MAVFEYETWSGLKRLVTADKVAFKPGHVLFLRQLPETGADT